MVNLTGMFDYNDDTFIRVEALQDFRLPNGKVVHRGSLGGRVAKEAYINGDLWCNKDSEIEPSRITGNVLTSGTVTNFLEL